MNNLVSNRKIVLRIETGKVPNQKCKKNKMAALKDGPSNKADF